MTQVSISTGAPGRARRDGLGAGVVTAAARVKAGFRPRDRVVWLRFGKKFYGAIVKVHKITALVVEPVPKPGGVQ